MFHLRKNELYFLVIMLTVFSCGKFTYSPYETNTENLNINTKHLAKIATRDGDFSTTFKIAVLSDTHDYYTDLEKQVDYINKHEDDYAFVIHTGDATNLGMLVEWEMFYKFIKDLKVPFIMVIGNHDMLTNGTDIYKSYFGKSLNFSFVFKQTEFFLYNNNNWESLDNVPNLDSLDSSLQASSATNKIVFSHVAPNDSARFSKSKISEVENIISNNSVNYYVRGHDHNYGASTFGGATHVTVGSSVKGKLLELTISNGGVSHNFIDI